MSSHIQSYTQCDECGSAYNYFQGHHIQLLRRQAKADGWIHKNNEDICPDCQEEQPHD